MVDGRAVFFNLKIEFFWKPPVITSIPRMRGGVTLANPGSLVDLTVTQTSIRQILPLRVEFFIESFIEN